MQVPRDCQRLRNAIAPLITLQTAPTTPIYSMDLPRLQASTYEEANTTPLMRNLFRILSGEIRLALGTAQLNSLGQHRSTAFLCWVLPGLGSSWPCIPSAKGIILHRHVPEAIFSLASSHLSGVTCKSMIPTCTPPSPPCHTGQNRIGA